MCARMWANAFQSKSKLLFIIAVVHKRNRWVSSRWLQLWLHFELHSNFRILYYIIIFSPQHESRNTRRAREMTAIGREKKNETHLRNFFFTNIVIVKYFIQVLICSVHWVYLLTGWLATLHCMRLFNVLIVCESLAEFLRVFSVRKFCIALNNRLHIFSIDECAPLMRTVCYRQMKQNRLGSQSITAFKIRLVFLWWLEHRICSSLDCWLIEWFVWVQAQSHGSW